MRRVLLVLVLSGCQLFTSEGDILKKAQVRLEAGDPAGARVILVEACEKKNVLACVAQASQDMEAGDLEEARRLADLGLSHRKDDPAALVLSAGIALAAEDYERTEELCSRILGQFPDHHIAQVNLVLVHLGRGEVAEAQVKISRILAERPGSALAHGVKGDVLKAKGEREAARASWRKALDLDDSLVPARVQLLDDAIERGDLNAQKEQLEQLSLLHPTWSTWVRRGAVELTLGNPAAAKYAFEHAVELDPRAVPGVQGLGRSLMALGFAREAVGLLTRARAAAPEDSGVAVDLARAFFMTGQLDAARVELASVLKSEPSNGEAVALQGLIALSAEQGHRGRALLRRAIKLDPALIEPRLELARQALMAEDPSTAAEHLAALPAYARRQDGVRVMEMQRKVLASETLGALLLLEDYVRDEPGRLDAALSLPILDRLAGRPEIDQLRAKLARTDSGAP